jgi:hypothetical protein
MQNPRLKYFRYAVALTLFLAAVYSTALSSLSYQVAPAESGAELRSPQEGGDVEEDANDDFFPAPLSSATARAVPPPEDVASEPHDALGAHPPLGPSASRRNFLFIKTPKVGGTTLAVTLQRAALLLNQSIAVPVPRMDRLTCGVLNDDAQRVWGQMLHRNPGGLEVFASQVCFHPFMRSLGWRDKQKPVLLGLVRDPWARWLSAWRYLEKRCAEEDPEMPPDIQRLCTSRLPRGFERYSLDACAQSLGTSTVCSVQHAWLSPDRGMGALAVVKLYDLILVTEAFDESLVVLHYDHGVPLAALPYLVSNQDKSAPMPHFSSEAKRRILERGLSNDVSLYNNAKARLLKRVEELNASTQGQFGLVLARLTRAHALAQQQCSGPDTMDENDCIVTHHLIKKTESCRHKCLDRIWAATSAAAQG